MRAGTLLRDGASGKTASLRFAALIRPRSQACAGCASLPAMGTFSHASAWEKGKRGEGGTLNLAPMGESPPIRLTDRQRRVPVERWVPAFAGMTSLGNQMIDTKTDALIVFTPSGKRGRFALGTPVLTAARTLGVDIDSVCGGRAICGRC